MQLAIPVAFHVALSCNSLNTFKCSIVCCSHFKVGGKRDTGGRGKGNIEVSSENETSEMFCCSVAFVNFAVFLFSVDWSLLSYLICFQNHFPFSTFNLWRNKWCCMFPAAEEKWKRTPKSCALVSVRPSSSRTAVLFNHTSQFHSFQMISPLLPIFGQINTCLCYRKHFDWSVLWNTSFSMMF